jgi:hypothetical protein
MTASEQLHDERSKLVETKQALMSDLQGIKQKLLRTLPHGDFARMEAQRVDLVRQIQMIDGKLAVLNSKKHIASQVENAARPLENKLPCVKQLVALREKYQQFAADGSRVASMRRMASEFVLELNPIIKLMVSKKETAPE